MNSQPHRVTSFVAAFSLALLQGCTTLTHFDATPPSSVLSLRDQPKLALPADLKMDSKATGQHEFKVVAPGGQTLYGLLPLSVNGGTMAGSILFFAPALFIGGFRDTFGFYEFDPDAGVLRFKAKATDEWRSVKPTAAVSARAKAFFDAQEARSLATSQPSR